MLDTGPVNTPASSIHYKPQPQAKMSLKVTVIVFASTIAAAVAVLAFVH
jgi:hypothetical protein